MYRKKPFHAYSQSRTKKLYRTITTSHHRGFRAEWELNLKKAAAEAQALEKEGFLVEEAFERGAYMESQANRVAKQLQEQGYEVKTVPVASWADEKVVFLVYKPPKEPVPSAPQPAPSRQFKPRPSPEELAQQFAKNTWVAAPARELDRFKNEGWMMSPSHVTAFISKDAKTSVPDSLVGMLKDFQSGNTAPLAVLNAKNFLSAMRKAKLSRNIRYVKFAADIQADVDYIREAVRIFSGDTVKVFCKAKERPIYFVDSEGNAVAVAPAIDAAAPSMDVQSLMQEFSF